MIFARIETCGCRMSRLRVYASSCTRFDGTSVTLMLLVSESAVTAPRMGQRRSTVNAGWLRRWSPSVLAVTPGSRPPNREQSRERRCVTICATLAARV
jgi:hypothetical protein